LNAVFPWVVKIYIVIIGGGASSIEVWRELERKYELVSRGWVGERIPYVADKRKLRERVYSGFGTEPRRKIRNIVIFQDDCNVLKVD
jgi:hypothetical protein